MEMAELFKHFGSLFETFQWWSLLLIAGVILVMIPINMLLKKLMNKESLERLRKVIAFVCVYLISAGVVALFTWIATEVAMTFTYVAGASLALGFCAQFGWEIVKLIRDYGWKKVAAWLAKKVEEDKLAKTISTKYGVDKSLVKTLIADVKAKININTDDVEKAFTEDTEIITEIHDRLSNVVNAENLEEATQEIYKALTK